MSRKAKASGGEANFGKPRADWKEEANSKPKAYAGEGSNVQKEAEEKKRGGSAKRHKRKRGGGIHEHHEKGKDLAHAKHIGAVHGDMHAHKGRAPRKAGGRAGSNFSPLSSAHAGTAPRDHKTTSID